MANKSQGTWYVSFELPRGRRAHAFLHEKVILCSVWQSLMVPWKIQPILEEVIPWTKISCANWRNVSDRSTQGSGWGSRRITKHKCLAKGLSSFIWRTCIRRRRSFEMYYS